MYRFLNKTVIKIKGEVLAVVALAREGPRNSKDKGNIPSGFRVRHTSYINFIKDKRLSGK